MLGLFDEVLGGISNLRRLVLFIGISIKQSFSQMCMLVQPINLHVVTSGQRHKVDG